MYLKQINPLHYFVFMWPCNAVAKFSCHFTLPFPFSFSWERCQLSTINSHKKDTARPSDKRVMWLYGWKALVLSRHPAKCGGRWHCGSSDIFLVAKEKHCTCSLKSVITIYLWSTRHVILPYMKFHNVDIPIYCACSGFKLWDNG